MTENIPQLTIDHQPFLGLIKCKILPPHGLLHPVLPVCINKKLLFPLCRTCALQQNSGDCFHTDKERTLKGSWVSLEVDKVLELGYKVLDTWSLALPSCRPVLTIKSKQWTVCTIHKHISKVKDTGFWLAIMGKNWRGQGLIYSPIWASRRNKIGTGSHRF